MAEEGRIDLVDYPAGVSNRPTSWDLIGAAVTIIGMSVIMFGPRSA